MMEILRSLCKSLAEFYESDEVADKIIKHDYFFSTVFSGIYPIMEKRYRFCSLLFLTANLSISTMHIEAAIRATMNLYNLNFTLLTFMVQIYLILQFCILVVITLNMKRKDLQILHKEMIGDFFHYGEDHADVLEALNKEMNKEKKQLLSLPVMLTIVGGNMIIISPIIDSSYGSLGFNVTNTLVPMDTPLPFAYPFPTSHPSLFYVICLLQGLIMLFSISTIGSASLLFINIVQYFTMHQRYLLEMINRIESRTEELFKNTYGASIPKKARDVYQDKRYQKCFEECLKKCFSHHQHLLRWFHSMDDLVSLPIGISYVTGTFVIALSLISMKTGTSLPGTAITSFMMCILEVCFIALLSVLGQRIADLNEDLRRAVYNIKWYFCNKSVKTNMKIFQQMSLRPMQIKGFGLINANLDTFANVMNSAYSYYNFIMAV